MPQINSSSLTKAVNESITDGILPGTNLIALVAILYTLTLQQNHTKKDSPKAVLILLLTNSDLILFTQCNKFDAKIR